ncbi:methyltransferase [Mangrovactinospora gilvigrisea]|uniref:Methyltransferase n=1 Tax=Mangrovactinospora gilvigrisea TaxID=1428644 RepID=A0A1J7BKS8_9ACTN|nr:class I SAM-dependent methyltransferase [Mangrovactinospora gilvigrisea]OIV39246.1 methyltransferase [Mangrovactinospora gilvigrisea]
MDPVEIDEFKQLLTEDGRAVLHAVTGYRPDEELALATRLRRTHPASLVTAALHQERLRQRAAAKFGEDAARLWFTPNGVEQSTRTSVAAHRAARLADLRPTRVADLCCGIGGDALALARAGIPVLAVDRDPLACAAAEANAAALGLADLIEVRCADVTAVDPATEGCDAVFVDPARRGGRGRVFDPEAYSPPFSWAVETARQAPLAALKVAPGIPHEAVPEEAAAEWVSDGGDVKEAVIWFGTGTGSGNAGRGPSATLLPSGRTLVSRGLPDPEPAPVRRYLYEPDGAVIRAHLVAEAAEPVGGTLIDPTIAYFTSDTLTADHPFAAAYEITDVLPFNIKRLKALLRERGAGTVTVKKRGSSVLPEELLKKLKPSGPNRATVFLTRVAGDRAMLVGAPAADAADRATGRSAR